MNPDHAGDFSRIGGLNIALDERDTATSDHCDRASFLALALGRRLGLGAGDLRCLVFAARMHDVGKIGIPDTVLKKSGKLTDAEWDVMKSHAVRSERIVRASDLADADAIARAVRHHHERYDGGGYPDGLAREAIPGLARVVAVVDAYDAMAHLRLYGGPMRHREIVIELARVSGTQHDPHISRAFAAIIETSPYRAE